jgi:hypothetical protein
LKNALFQVGGKTCVKCFGFIGHEIYVISFHDTCKK